MTTPAENRQHQAEAAGTTPPDGARAAVAEVRADVAAIPGAEKTAAFLKLVENLEMRSSGEMTDSPLGQNCRAAHQTLTSLLNVPNIPLETEHVIARRFIELYFDFHEIGTSSMPSNMNHLRSCSDLIRTYCERYDTSHDAGLSARWTDRINTEMQRFVNEGAICSISSLAQLQTFLQTSEGTALATRVEDFEAKIIKIKVRLVAERIRYLLEQPDLFETQHRVAKLKAQAGESPAVELPRADVQHFMNEAAGGLKTALATLEGRPQDEDSDEVPFRDASREVAKAIGKAEKQFAKAELFFDDIEITPRALAATSADLVSHTKSRITELRYQNFRHRLAIASARFDDIAGMSEEKIQRLNYYLEQLFGMHSESRRIGDTVLMEEALSEIKKVYRPLTEEIQKLSAQLDLDMTQKLTPDVTVEKHEIFDRINLLVKAAKSIMTGVLLS